MRPLVSPLNKPTMLSAKNHQNHSSTKMNTASLVMMGFIHFCLMFILMYAMVDVFENVLLNLNQVYMALFMTAPMLIMEIFLMYRMYENKNSLKIIFVISVFVFALSFFFIRQQTGISDREFLKSMIPHHAGAILMCRKAPIQDPGIRDLCRRILISQQAEIDEMKQKLDELR